MMKSWKIAAAMFSAVAVFAAEPDYESISKYVPAANDGLAYLNTEKFSGSVFIEEIKKLGGDMADMSAMPDEDGALLLSLNSAAPEESLSVLFVVKGVSTLDELAAKSAENDKVKVEKVKVGEHDALRFEGAPMGIFAVDDGVFAMIPDGQADGFFAAAKGVNADLNGRVAALKDKPLFGSFNIPAAPEDAMPVNRCDVVGGLAEDGKAMTLTAMLFMPDEKAAAQAVQEIQGGIMVFTMAAAQQDPALGSMLMTAIKLTADKNIMNIDLNITPELIAKLQEMGAAPQMTGDAGAAAEPGAAAETAAVSVK